MENPNILWITLDSVRADHTSLHGYHRNTTPEIARITSDSSGANFAHGIAHSTRTPVSVPSMLTGLYPSQHQIVGEKSGYLIPDSITTAPELFAEEGYRTICVSENGHAGKGKGLDKLFDEFVDSKPKLPSALMSYDHAPGLLKYAFRVRKHGPGLTFDASSYGEQNSFLTTDITKRRLRRSTDSEEPFFCYVHYDDTHHAYKPPLSYAEEYTDEIDKTAEEALEFADDMHDNLYEYMADGVPFTDEQWEMLYAMYDSIIKYVDSCVGHLFDYVQKKFEDTITIVTSDHGDLFGERGLLGHHIVLHDALIHVPLVTHGIDEITSCTDQPTQHIDVMQTLLSLAGADTSQFQGYNLINDCREIAVSQDLRGTVDDDEAQNYERIRQYNPDVDLSHLPKSLLTSARTTEFKLLHTDEWTKLYKLPDESKDVKESHPSVYEDLLSYTQEWLNTEGQPFDATPKQADLTEETEQRLREMGYLE